MPDPTPTPAPSPGATPAPSPTPNSNPTPSPDPGSAPSPGAAPTPEPAKGWGDNWRQQYAGEDAKLLQRLERYQSPKAALDALISAQNKIQSGELRKPLGESATPEEIAAYRQQNGIPEKAEGYFEKLPDGLVIGDTDKPMFNSFAEGLHKLNADPKIAQYAVGWYNKLQEEQTAKLAEGDTSAKTATEDELRTEWGGDYRANINHIQGFLAQAPASVADLLGNARSGDGKAIMNDPNVVRWLASVARDMNPTGTIVPAGGTVGKGLEDEITEIETFMKTNRTEYRKDEKKQSRLRDLYDARTRQQARGK